MPNNVRLSPTVLTCEKPIQALGLVISSSMFDFYRKLSPLSSIVLSFDIISIFVIFFLAETYGSIDSYSPNNSFGPYFRPLNWDFLTMRFVIANVKPNPSFWNIHEGFFLISRFKQL